MISKKWTDLIRHYSNFFALLSRHFGFVIFWLLLINVPEGISGIVVREAAVPQHLCFIQSQVNRAHEAPLIFLIGEEHVSFEIQQAVADILRYVSSAYDVNLVCIEGYSGPIVIPRRGLSPLAQRFIAYADFKANRISGVEYFALSYPEVNVIGVEDMAAYNAHAKQLDRQSSLEKEAAQWDDDFKLFLSDELGNQTVAVEDAEQINRTLQHLIQKNDFGPFTNAIYDIFGRNSPVAMNLTALIEQHNNIKNFALSATANFPEMKVRDQAIVSGTLRAMKDSRTMAAILVVGHAHLAGIEELLDKKRVSYVSIVPVGVGERLRGTSDDDGEMIYRNWREGKKTGLEAWLSRLKPSPALARHSFRDRTLLLGILATAERLRRQGLSEREVLEVTRRSPLPEGVSINGVFDITDGMGMAFTANDRHGYIYFAGSKDQLGALGGGGGGEPLETGDAGGMYYAVFGNSGHGQPPIPPKRERNGHPTDNFRKTYLAGIEEQKTKRLNRVTILFRIEGGCVVRWVDDEKKMVLNATPDEIEELRKRFENAEIGPDKLFVAQKLADALLVSLNKQFPIGKKELIQISENDMIGDLSLPFLQALAGNEDASRLASIDLDKVIVMKWDKRQENVPRLGLKIRGKTQTEKVRALNVIRKETKGIPLKNFLRGTIDKAKKMNLAPAVETISHATPFTVT
jgi:hypothetical protein